MTTPYICLACRHRIPRIWLRQAAQRTNTTAVRRLSTIHDDPLRFLETDAATREKEAPGKTQTQWTPLSRGTPTIAEPQLEELFQSTIKPASFLTTTISSTTALAPFKHAETLKTMVAEEKYLASETWAFFLEHFGPSAWGEGTISRASIPSYLYARRGGYTGVALVNKIMKAKALNQPSIPSLTEVLSVYAQLDIMNGNDTIQAMYSLARLAVEQSSEEHVLDLLGSWHIFSRTDKVTRTYKFEDISQLNWSNWPSHVPSPNIKHRTKKHGVSGAFTAFLPIKLYFKGNDGIAALALTIFSLVSSEIFSTHEAAHNAKPFLTVVAKIINAEVLQLEKVLSNVLLDPKNALIENYLQSHWDEIAGQANECATPEAYQPVEQPSDSQRVFVKNLPRLEDAVRRVDIPQIDKMWSDMAKLPIYTNDDFGPRGTLSGQMCNQFIQAYMSLKKPDRAIGVWNDMIDTGLTPSLASWDSMLIGCKTSRDAKALEEVWSNMEAAGVNPDIHCWTSRISGLFESNRTSWGMAALDSMSANWLTKARARYGRTRTTAELRHVGDLEGAVKPAIQVINAAITALLKRYREDDAHRVLAWAGNFGTKPDVITYNTLLRFLIRQKRTKEGMSILTHMKNDGIPADVATFTIILEETFRNAEEQTVEQQHEVLASVFAEMEEAGVKANTQTYGRIIYQLMIGGTSDLTAVNAVLARMAREGLEPSSYIYTIFIEYYFRQDPPDVDAIRGLIQRVREKDDGSVDHIFWDRVINGYAEMGDTASALRILGQVSSTNLRKTADIGYPTLEIVVSALVKNEEWMAVKDLVRNIAIDTGGPIPEHVHGKNGQHRFWKVVQALDLSEA
ncbi:hypothetical protein BJ878DRAFT_516161 [Calycina marina]|uniref:Pentatricopeptide repeat-containing protein n=1 Tax=Calycina marina TaxID=1763456 RepID=A0A9P7YZL9_9HELO|nr:hypothetical protein BJ878DRAFT_516161 [Calycina marina]